MTMSMIHSYLAYFANPWLLSLLGILPVLGLFALLGYRRRRRVLVRWSDNPTPWTAPAVVRRRRVFRSACFAVGLFLLATACAGPQWGQEEEPALASGRDVVVVLDLSRSMLAEDVLPNRLGRAKEALNELADTVQQQGGHRLALVAFAGQARVICPLTPDYDHFRWSLVNLEASDPLLTPKSVGGGPASGTRIGSALRQAVELHDPRYPGRQDILLISDGDDPLRDDNEWQAGAAEARAHGISIYTVGIGNPESDSPIPDVVGQPLRHENKEILTRLQEKLLQEIARQTGGVYTPARLDIPPMQELFRKCIQPGPSRNGGDDALPIYRQRYPWFFGAALGLLALTMGISDLPKKVLSAEC